MPANDKTVSATMQHMIKLMVNRVSCNLPVNDNLLASQELIFGSYLIYQQLAIFISQFTRDKGQS